MQINTLTFNLDEVSVLNALQQGAWVEENTAILVMHGVGNQRPLETLDMFARGLVNVYLKRAQLDRESLILEHRIAVKNNADGRTWFDNFIRFRSATSDFHIDVYECFWAHHPEEQVSVKDLQKWVEHTAQGAEDFYAQKQFAEKNGDSSYFIKNQEFDAGRYRRTLWLAVQVIPALTRIMTSLLNFARIIPGIGGFASRIFEKFRETAFTQLTSVAGDVVAYNTMDEKARLHEIRRRVLNSAVDALRYLIEPRPLTSTSKKKERQYDNVIVVAHSLGTQISFDAINKLSHMISQDEIEGVARNGDLIGVPGGAKKHVSDLLSGYATFGSPLDKIAFFFRDRTKKEEYLRRQILKHFHCFKEKDWDDRDEGEFPLNDEMKARFFQNIQWRNYFDCNDPISGRLDYYDKVHNIDCLFVKHKPGDKVAWYARFWPFTHSYYWSSEMMFADIVANLVHRNSAQMPASTSAVASRSVGESAA